MNLSKPIKSVIYTLFFVSGFTGLVYEVTWTRLLSTIFGSNTYAVTSVLAAFMGGLAIGSYVIGRFVERKKNPLLVYAILEIGIGFIALLIPAIYSLLDRFYPLVYEHIASSTGLLILTKVVLSLLVLLIPTFLMGGTLPVLCKLFIKRLRESGKQAGILYSINTLGAAIGCFVTGFFLIELFGIVKSMQLAAGVNLLLGALFFIFSIYVKAEKSEIDPNKTENKIKAAADTAGPYSLRPLYSSMLLVAFFLAGFVALSYEILWTRLLVFKLKMTIYAFAIMLTTFLTGIGIGSVVAAILEKYKLIKDHPRAFGMIQSSIGLTGLLTIFLFSQIDVIPLFDAIGDFKSSVSWGNQIFTEILLAGMIMIVPTLLMGMTFPIVSRIFTKDIKVVGKTIGSIYSINTIGSIFGSCLTGFLFVRIMGTQTNIIFISLIAITVGTAIVLFSRKGLDVSKKPRPFPILFVSVVWAVVIGVIVWMPKDILFNFYNIYEKHFSEDVRIIYAKEGIECITTVHEYPDGFRGISTSSINVAGTHYTHRTTQKLQAHIPMLVHPDPKEILQVGFGSGETSHIVTSYDINQLDLVEISREVINTSTKYFNDINKDVANHPKFNPIIMDGANYIRLTRKTYDLILNDASWPGYTGCSALYSKDYFENARKLLKPGGIMTSWIPIEKGDDFRILLKTFHSVFPNVSVWLAMTHVNKHALVMASLNNIEIDTEHFLKRFKRYAQNDLRAVDLDNPVFFLDTYQMDERAVSYFPDSVPLHTLDHPILEFTNRKRDPVENISALKIMTEHYASVIPYLKNSSNILIDGKPILPALQSTREATRQVISGYIRVIEPGEYQPKFESEFKDALRIEPHHPGANHFFFRMFHIHVNLAENYARNQNHKYADYCYKLALREINFYLSLRPEVAKAYHYRGLIFLNGSQYLGMESKEGLLKAREDFSLLIRLDPEYAQDNGIRTFIDRIDQLL